MWVRKQLCLLCSGKQASDPNAAAWAAYYAQFYGQGGVPGTQPTGQPSQQPQQPQQVPVGYGAGGPAVASTQAAPVPSATGAQPQPSKLCMTTNQLSISVLTGWSQDNSYGAVLIFAGLGAT